jgi:ankyrin repeat protein
MAERKRRSWRSISLRSLLLFMLACGCMLGLIGRESRQAKRRAEIVRDLSKAAGKIDVEYVNLWGRKTSSPPPDWQASILGESFFQHVTAVVIQEPDLLPDDGALLGELRHLRSFQSSDTSVGFSNTPIGTRQTLIASYLIEIEPTRFADEQVAGLKPLRRLENVSLRGAALTDSGLECLSPRNPLLVLDVSFTEITDQGAEHLGRFRTLEHLDVSNTWISDEGMKHLARLPRLKSLTLSSVMVSDEGLRTLAQSSSLERLDLSRLAITRSGLVHLARLPKLRSVNLDGVDLSRADILRLGHNSLSKPVAGIEPATAFWAIGRDAAPKGVRYLRYLLEHGADPNTPRNVGGISPLAAFVVENDREAVELLLTHGAEVNQRDDGGRTPVSMAAERGQLGMMELLLGHGAQAHPPGAQSAVCSAAATGQIESIKLLVQHGADVSRPNHHGHTPLEAAVHYPRAYELLMKLGAELPKMRP